MFNVGDLLAILRLQDEMSGVANNVANNTLPNLDNAVKGTAYQLTLLGRGMREAGTLMTGVFTVPILAATDAIIKFGGGFEKEMTKVVNLGGASRQELDGLKQSTLALAEATGIGPQELAKGLYVLESYGFKAAKTMDVLTIAAKMSAIGMGSTEQAALGLTGAMFAYKEQNMTAAEAGNIFVKAVRLGNMEINDLIPAMATVNPIAASLGVSMQDVAASIATFTHAGVNSAVASTGLRAMLSNILSDSTKTEKGFRALAVATGDNTITMANFRKEMADKGLTQAMVDLSDSATKAGDAGVAALNKIFPNIRALTNALAVYKLNGGLVVDINNEMRRGEDTLADTTAELAKTWDQQWKQMTTSIEVLWIKLSTSLLPIFKETTGFFRDSLLPTLSTIVDGFNNLPRPIQVAMVLVAGFLALLGPGVLIMGQFAMAIGNIARGFAVLSGAESGAVVLSSVAGFLANPFVWGGAAVLLALGAALLYFSASTKVDTETTEKSITAHEEQLKQLSNIEKQFYDSKTAADQYHSIAQQLIDISPNAISSVGGESVEYNKLRDAIHNAKLEKLDMLATDQKILGEQIKQKEAQATALIAKVARDQSIFNSASTPITGVFDPDAKFGDTTLKTQSAAAYTADSAALRTLNAELDENRQRYQATREVLDPLYHSVQEHARAIAATTEAAAKSAGATASLAGANLTLLEQVKNLDAAQRSKIESDKAQHMTIAQIAVDTKLSTDVVGIYIRQLSAASTANTKAEAEQKRLATATAEAASKLQQYTDEYDRVIAQTNGNSLAAQDAGIKKWFDHESAALDALATKHVDVTQARIELDNLLHAKLDQSAEAHADHEQEVASKISAMWSEYDKAVAQGDEDTLAAQLASIDKWYQEQRAAILKAGKVNEDELTRLNSLDETYWAKRHAREAAAVTAHANALSQFKTEDDKTAQDTLAIWDHYNSIVAKMNGDSVASQIAASKAAVTKALGVTQEHLAKELLAIKKNINLTEVEKASAYSRALAAAKDQSDAIIKLSEIEAEAIRKAQHTADVQAIAAGITAIGGQLKNTEGQIITSVGNMAVAYDQWKSKSLDTAQKIGAAMQGVATVMQVTSGTEKGKTLSGAMAGAQAGMAFGPWGAAIGAAAGALVGFIRGLNDGRQTVENFAKSIYDSSKPGSGFDQLHEQLLALGSSGEQMWIDLTQGVPKGNADDAKAEIKKVQDAIAALAADIQKYNLTWADIADPVQRAIASQKAAGSLIASFNRLHDAGYSIDSIVKNMSTDVNDWLTKTLEAGEKIPPAMQPIIEQMIRTGQVTEQNARLMLGLADDGVPSLDEIKAAADRYGLSLDELGPKVQQLRITDQANQIVKDFKTLVAAGVPFDVLMRDTTKDVTDAGGVVTQVTTGMHHDIQEMVLKSLGPLGVTLPDAMKPIIQQMIDMGGQNGLVDQFGNQLTGLGDLHFDKPLSQSIDELVSALGELVKAFQSMGDEAVDQFGRAAGAADRVQVPRQSGTNSGQGSTGAQQEDNSHIDGNPDVFPQAAGGDYMVTRPTLFLAGEAGPERATFTPKSKMSGSDDVAAQIVAALGPILQQSGAPMIDVKVYVGDREVSKSVRSEWRRNGAERKEALKTLNS